MKLLLGSLFVLVASSAYACDPCSLYNASRLFDRSEGSLTLSLSQQYTNFERTDGKPENSVKEGEFVRDFNTTQLSAYYDLSSQFGLQLSIPLISRRFDDIENFRTDTKSEFGLGDITLAGNYTFLNYRSGDWVVFSSALAGVKLPTGDTGTLEDIAEVESDEEEHEEGELQRGFLHHQLGSATGGRALSLGTGSVDAIFGWNFLTRYQRALFLVTTQYGVRTEGDFNYEFGDDFIWSVGPGAYLVLNDDYTIAARVAVSGEEKPKDSLNGSPVAGSQISNLYVGPEMLVTISDSVAAEVGIDFRVSDASRDSTVTPEFRVRSGIAYRF